MTYYCESCNVQNKTDVCPKCGRKHLRQIKDDDFCFFMQMDSLSAENLKSKLDGENIGCALIPFGTGFRTVLGVNLEDYLVFIEYKHLSCVEDLFARESQRKMQNLKQEVVENIDKLHIRPKDEKTIKRKLKLARTFDLVQLCKDVILTATTVIDAGMVIDDDLTDYCDENGDYISSHYYRVSNAEYEVGLYSPSYRVCKIVKL